MEAPFSSPNPVAQDVLSRLLKGSPPAVTYTAIEAAITDAGFDPLEANDLYLHILDNLDKVGVLAVDRLEALERTVSIDDEAISIADEILAQLHHTQHRINQLSVTKNRGRERWWFLAHRAIHLALRFITLLCSSVVPQRSAPKHKYATMPSLWPTIAILGRPPEHNGSG